MAAYRGCRAVPARSAQWRSHGPIQPVPIRRRGTRRGGCGGRGINHLEILVEADAAVGEAERAVGGVGVGTVVAGDDHEPARAAHARGLLDRADQRARDSAAAGVLAHHERDDLRPRRVALQDVADVERGEARQVFGDEDARALRQAVEAPAALVRLDGVAELAQQGGDRVGVAGLGAPDLHRVARASRRSPISDATMPTVNASATTASDATWPTLYVSSSSSLIATSANTTAIVSSR